MCTLGWWLLLFMGNALAHSHVASEKSVLLWLGNPFGWQGGPFNKTKLNNFLNGTAQLKDVVDVVSPVAFIVADPASAEAKSTGGLILTPGSKQVIEGLQGQGFRVEPLIGDTDTGSGNKVDWYRHYFSSEAFKAACVNAVSELKLDGLNFDFEPHDCATRNCSSDDARSYAQMLTDIQRAVKGKGPGGADARISVDTGQCAIANTDILKSTEARLLITMNTYGDTADFDIALPRDLARDGAERFSLGVCPGCFASNESDVEYRMSEATRLGVRNVAYWAGTTLDSNTTVWWREIRKWKAAAIPQSTGLDSVDPLREHLNHLSPVIV